MFNLSDPNTVGRIVADPDFLLKFFTVLPDPVLTYDVKRNRIIYYNDRLEATLGYSAADIEAMGGNLLSIVVEQHVSPVAQRAGENFAGVDDTFVFGVDYVMRHKNGEHRCLHAKLGILKRDEDGQPAEMLAIFEDVTEAKQSQSALEKVRDLLQTSEEHFSYGSWTWNLETDRVVWSKGMFELLGIDEDRYPGREVPAELYSQHIPDADRRRMGSVVEAAIAAGQTDYSAEHWFNLPDGGRKHISVRAVIHYDEQGKARRIIGTCSDNTKSQSAREALQRAQNLLKTSEQLFRYGSWFWDPTQPELIVWSDGVFELLEVSPADYPGNVVPFRLYGAFIDADAVDRVYDAIDQTLRQHKTGYAQEHWSTTRGGRRIYLSLRASIEYDADGQAIAVIGTCSDITDYQRVRQELLDKVEELNRLNVQLEYQQDWLEEAEVLTGFGSFEWDVAANKLYWSEGMYHLFGYGDADQRPAVTDYDFWFAHLHPDDRGRVARTMTEHLEAREPFEDLEHRIYDRNGALRFLVCQGKMVINQAGEVTRILGSAVDVTQQHRYQRELEDMVQALRHSNRHLEEFAYVASHDLREPLRKIISFGDRLQARYQGNLDEEGALYLQRMQEAAKRMERLIDDLLHFSRVTRRNNDAFVRVNPREALQSVLKDLEVTIDRREATVYISDGPWSEIEAIETQLEQYIQNIISNSLKFAKPGTPPRIEVYCAKVLGEDTGRPDLKPDVAYFKLEIRDNGIGFEPEYAERIFTLFQRLNGRGDYEGNGIGLAICKKIAENHQGVVYADSRPGEGATFTLLLPASQN